MGLPTDYQARKQTPICTGVIDYFPDALAEVSQASLAGNKQHLDGQPLRWDKSKSSDEADALVRHLIQRGTKDSDGVRHSAKVAWRALALLQREIDAEARIAEATAKALRPTFGSDYTKVYGSRMENDIQARSRDLSIAAMERIVNPPVIERQVWIDKGDGKIVGELRLEPAYGHSVLDDLDVRALTERTARILRAEKMLRRGRLPVKVVRQKQKKR